MHLIKNEYGVEIELSMGDAYGGPKNCFSRLNVNSLAMFYRKPGGQWKHCGYRGRTMHYAMELAQLAHSFEEFEDAVTSDR